jgi:hypothetical protein
VSAQSASTAPEREQGLKQDAIGFVDALVIGLASTAPAYSLAAVIGIVVVIAGVQAPAVLLASFVPMFFIAAAFYYMNRADQTAARPSRGSRARWGRGPAGSAAGPSARRASSSSARSQTSPRATSTC